MKIKMFIIAMMLGVTYFANASKEEMVKITDTINTRNGVYYVGEFSRGATIYDVVSLIENNQSLNFVGEGDLVFLKEEGYLYGNRVVGVDCPQNVFQSKNGEKYFPYLSFDGNPNGYISRVSEKKKYGGHWFTKDVKFLCKKYV
jgi:hypothetical protein